MGLFKTLSQGYGAIHQEHQNGNGDTMQRTDETTNLLSNSNNKHFKKPNVFQRLGQHLAADVDTDWGDLALLFCYIITGLLDSSSTSIWGSFVSMQTGNTVYVGLGIASPGDSDRWIRSGVSILSFCLGSLFFSRLHRSFGARKRWVLLMSYIIQLLLIVAAALMVTLGPEESTDERINVFVVVPLAILAFQASGQAVISRVLKYGSLTSVVLTSIYCDLFSDQKLFTAPLAENIERNRRAAAPLLLLVGAVAGGLWAHSPFGMAGALWTAVVLKLFVVVTWVFWRAERRLEG